MQRRGGSVRKLLQRIALLSLGSVGALGCAGGGDVASPHSQVCASVDCRSSVSYSGALTVAAADLPRLEVLLCRNGVCATTRLATADDVTWSATVVGPLGGPLSSTGSTGSTLGGSVSLSGFTDVRKLSIFLYGTAATFSDGDEYVIRIGVPGDAPLLDLKRTVSYEVLRPAGPDCDLVCKKAVLS